MKKRLKNIKTKIKVVEETVQTEKTYIEGLEWLIKWRNEILEQEIAKKEEVEILFSTVIDNIKLISEQILQQVTRRFESWEKDSCIGDLFINLAPFLKQYKDYCNNNEKSGKMLDQLIKKNKKFNQYLSEQEKLAGNRFESYLITPIQRIPRYEMLLGAAKKHTNKDQPDYDKLTQALEKVKEVCNSNNKEMAAHTGQKRKIELQEIYGSKINLMLPQRNLVKEFHNLYMIDVATDQPKE